MKLSQAKMINPAAKWNDAIWQLYEKWIAGEITTKEFETKSNGSLHLSLQKRLSKLCSITLNTAFSL